MFNRLLLIAMLSLPLHVFAGEVFTLEGELKHVPDSTDIQLLFLHSSLEPYTTQVNDGRFIFHGAIDRPTEALLMMKIAGKRTENRLLYLDTGYFKLVGDTGLTEASLLPSVINQQYEYYKKYMQQNLTIKSSGQVFKQFIQAHPGSFFSLVSLQDLAMDSLNNLDEIEALYLKLDTAVRSTKTAADFLKWMARARELKPGQQVPDLAAKDQAGKTVTLSALRGKYVLLHFWASWCPGCRNESPALLALYKQYKAKGLQVLNVSLDDNAYIDAWKKAIVKDRTGGFINVRSDQATISKAFNLKSIPLNLVIAPDGKIVTSETGTAGIVKAVTDAYAY